MAEGRTIVLDVHVDETRTKSRETFDAIRGATPAQIPIQDRLQTTVYLVPDWRWTDLGRFGDVDGLT